VETEASVVAVAVVMETGATLNAVLEAGSVPASAVEERFVGLPVPAIKHHHKE
jgi:hypothetical protein